jgi:predicted transcriptional regulator
MFNPEMYMEYLFLGLAQAVESYHAKFIGTKSQEKIKLEEEIRQIGQELSEEKANRLEEMTRYCFDASLRERVAAVYHEYANVADSLFKFKGEQEFSKKVKDTRNYLTHWSEDGEKKTAHGDDLVFLTKDLQLLLQLCIMTQLGFTMKDITKMYNVYYDGMKSLQDEDPDFFKQLITGGDTR